MSRLAASLERPNVYVCGWSGRGYVAGRDSADQAACGADHLLRRDTNDLPRFRQKTQEKGGGDSDYTGRIKEIRG